MVMDRWYAWKHEKLWLKYIIITLCAKIMFYVNSCIYNEKLRNSWIILLHIIFQKYDLLLFFCIHLHPILEILIVKKNSQRNC